MTTIDKATIKFLDTITAIQPAIAINDDDQQASAAKQLSAVKADSKVLKAKKEAVTKPLNAALKEIRAQFKPAEDVLENAEQVIKGAMLAYHEKMAAIAQKQIDAIENRVGAGKGHYKYETAMSKLADVAQPQTDLIGAQVKFGPARVQIVDPLLVPTVYLYDPTVIDAIRKAVQKDVSAGEPCPAGARLVRDLQIAGIA